MPIHQTATFRVRSDAVEAALAAVREFVAYVSANEPGTLHYTSLHRSDEPASFVHHFAFEDRAALEAHSGSEGVGRFTGVLYPLVEGEVEILDYELVATTPGWRIRPQKGGPRRSAAPGAAQGGASATIEALRGTSLFYFGTWRMEIYHMFGLSSTPTQHVA